MTWNRHGHAAMWGVLAVLLESGTLTTPRQASGGR
jgi:hypothetical protein